MRDGQSCRPTTHHPCSGRYWCSPAVRGQSDRNIRKLRKTIHKKLQRQMYDHMCGKQEHGGSLTLRERQFLEEYSKIARKQGKDAVIRRENKTKRRKKKNRP